MLTSTCAIISGIETVDYHLALTEDSFFFSKRKFITILQFERYRITLLQSKAYLKNLVCFILFYSIQFYFILFYFVFDFIFRYFNVNVNTHANILFFNLIFHYFILYFYIFSQKLNFFYFCNVLTTAMLTLMPIFWFNIDLIFYFIFITTFSISMLQCWYSCRYFDLI